MKILLVYNPASGAGRSLRIAEQAKNALEEAGHEAQLYETKVSYQAGEREALFATQDTICVFGGDGTLFSQLDVLIETGVPVYMLPTGNENLFARVFGMSVDSDQLLQALERGEIAKHYVPRANGVPFFTVLSAGLDSEVIAHIARVRTSAIGHRGYVLPILRCFLKHVAPTLRLTVDGKLCLDGQTGFLIIANSPHYALGWNPVPEASSDSAELVARFYPYTSRMHYLHWVFAALCRRPLKKDLSQLFCGKKFELEVLEPAAFPLQADGEFFANAPARVEHTGEVIKVLVPAE